MELRSGRRHCSTQHQHGCRCSPDLGPDHISALPDDLLLLILSRLRCITTAVRTGALSRRWRSLWTLLSELVFRHIEYPYLQTALASVVSPAAVPVSLLEIHVPMLRKFRLTREGGDRVYGYGSLGATGVTSLLRAAARLEPEGLILVFASVQIYGHVDLPGFHRATSIVLDSRTSICFRVTAAPGVGFAALDTLSLSGHIVGLDAMISQCPRLRVLRLMVHGDVATVHSPSLQELFVDSIRFAHSVYIVAPVFRKLTMSLSPYEQLNISVMAPMVETVSWNCSYINMKAAVRFGHWRLMQLALKTPERQGQLPSLHIHASSICSISYSHQEANFKREIKKHMVAAVSALELHLITSGHVFGRFVFCLIGMKRIRSVMRRLKVVIRRSKVRKGCPTNCICDPTSWKDQTISLIALEEMEVDGFEGNNHEFDFLKLVLKSSPFLKRVMVKLSHEDSSSSHRSMGLYDIFRAYSSVECCIYLSTGEYMPCTHDLQAPQGYNLLSYKGVD